MALRFLSIEPLIEDIGELDLRGIGWVIVGGESASDCHARGFDIEWARSIVGQCKASGVPCFVKQLGSRPTIAIRDNKGGDWAEWPADLRVREFPTEELA
jgi:protein gp37